MQRHVSVVHVVMGWSWVSLSTLPPHLCGPAAVLLQMKLPASLLGPTVIHLRAVVLFTMEDSSKVFAIGNIEQVAVAACTVDARRATAHWQLERRVPAPALDKSAQQRGLHQRPQGPLYPPVVP